MTAVSSRGWEATHSGACIEQEPELGELVGDVQSPCQEHWTPSLAGWSVSRRLEGAGYGAALCLVTKFVVVPADTRVIGLRLRLHDNAGGENATKSFRIHGSFTRYAEQNVKVVHQNGRKPKRWPRWKNLKTEMLCRINLGV